MIGPLLRSLGVTIRQLARGRVTEPLPWKGSRPRSERYRATFALVHDENGEEACIGCKKCENICPSEIITVKPGGRIVSPATGKKRGTASAFTLDLNACIVCELCVQVCPTDAIIMLRVPSPPGLSREDLVLTMDRLYANEKLQAPSWATGSRLVAMQDPNRPTPRPDEPAEEATAGAGGSP